MWSGGSQIVKPKRRNALAYNLQYQNTCIPSPASPGGSCFSALALYHEETIVSSRRPETVFAVEPLCVVTLPTWEDCPLDSEWS